MRDSRIALAVALASLVAGWALLAYTVFGEVYTGREQRFDSDGTLSSHHWTISMFDLGISSTTAMVSAGIALAYALVAVGALLNQRRMSVGRWLMLTTLIPLVLVNAVSFGLALLFPATITAAAATGLAFLSSPRRY